MVLVWVIFEDKEGECYCKETEERKALPFIAKAYFERSPNMELHWLRFWY
jgi:hypothetical protein